MVQKKLYKIRFDRYKKGTIKHAVKLSVLPPTDSAAKEHIFCVYLQTQLWLSYNIKLEE